MSGSQQLPGSVSSARRSIAASRGQERQLRRVFDESLVPMFMLDNERRIVDGNRATRLLLRADLAELKSLRAEALTPPHMAGNLVDAWATMWRNGQIAGAYDLLLPDGAVLEVVYSLLANVLPGLHLAVFMPASWPEDELGVDKKPAARQEPLRLSPREEQVLALIAAGSGLEQIAEELSISPLTAKTHLRNVHRKLGAHNRAHAIAIAIQSGLLGAQA